ncbi:hypothetical protein ACFX1R_010451 [Malus domestica]
MASDMRAGFTVDDDSDLKMILSYDDSLPNFAQLRRHHQLSFSSLSLFLSGQQQNGNHGKINETVVLMKKNVLDFNDLNASILNDVYELVGQWVSLQLISTIHADDSITA